ncbi:uncharacterized protein EI90DRAFT_3000061 [Cantharellus anzutake]|uniref:uncharacterized protein n=1 Tax=Cantharellus anzutake TaxID=1750568 RepID=UPI0019088030|nr:uncharacterized protein EI90DRAFT_3000061 [Cantharellus anzutake]KAF8325199.1 hypothetical protein EI90DRAFT_3000061 [Cantharellus anzutake]
MASLSAAELQKRHALEGAPDPFPSLNEPEQTRKLKQPVQVNGELLDQSEISFPSLVPAPSAARTQKAPASQWASGTGGIKRLPVIHVPVFASLITLPRVDLSRIGTAGKPTTLGVVVKEVMAKTKTKIEASSQRTTGATTFHVKGESELAVETATKQITASLSPHVTLIIEAPLSTIGTIIGPKGATLNKIREDTGHSVKVDIPRRDPTQVDASVAALDDEEPTLRITITGPGPLAEEVRSEITAIIATKKSKSTQRVRDVPVHIVPFVVARLSDYQHDEITVTVNQPLREVIVSGEREAVVRTIAKVKEDVNGWDQSLENVLLSIPKRQHRLLVGVGAQELMSKTHCAVIPTPFDEPGDSVTVWGKSDDIPLALGTVYETARSKYSSGVVLPGPISHASQVQTYLTRSAYLKNLSSSHPDVSVYVTSTALAQKTNSVNIDFFGDKAEVDTVVNDLNELIHKLEGALREVDIDWLVHRTLIGKNGMKIKQFQEQHNVLLFFPSESSELSKVLLVHDPLTLSPAAPTTTQKQGHLDDVQKEVLKLVADYSDVKSETIQVEQKWHSVIIGKNGTTLNAVIGEEKILSIKVGAQVRPSPDATPLGQDDIQIRGPSSEVDRAIREIREIVQKAEQDEIDNGYTLEFDFPREYLGRIVGTGGALANKLREMLGISLDFSDDNEEETDSKSKKKKPIAKCHVKIVGRKENAEEAKKRILNQVEKLADETTEILKIPRFIHAGLIGPSGKYVLRLEEKHSVKIMFPRESRDNEDGGSDEAKAARPRENLRLDEVLLRGGKKGVASAKAEIMEAVEYEKDQNQTLSFTVPTKAVSRILGKGGAQINLIKDDTGAQVDVEKAEGNETLVTARGSKEAVVAAKEAILAIANEVSDEITTTINIESRYHRNIIGPGGQNLRDTIVRAGGPSESRAQAGLVHFPRQNEPADEVRLRGPKALVAKIQAALEQITADLRDRVVLGAVVPASVHRTIIGRGGQNLNDIQARHGVTIQFPGSRSYHSAGDISNQSELESVDAADVVKVIGPSAACGKAIEELATYDKPAPELKERAHKFQLVTKTVSVPLKYHHAISQGGQFFRDLRSIGVTVDHSQVPEKPNASSRPTNGKIARIDDETTEDDGVEWQLAPNFGSADEAEAEWTFKARDQDGLDRALERLEDAKEQAKLASHIGFLTLADRSVFPRIVGTKGANIARLRADIGADIIVGRDDNTIVIIGTEASVLDAKTAILKIVNNHR